MSVSVATMTTLLVCFGLACLAAVTLADRLVAQGVTRDLLGVLQALVIIFLSSILGGLILRGAFRQWLGEDPDAGALTGVESIHPSREAARQRMLDWVDDPATRTIWLVGISHRDFLQPSGRLRDVWSAIHERLRQESQNLKPGDEKRLHVRVLLLNPESSEGMFRQHIEAASLNIPENRIGLSPDVEAALTELDRTNRELYSEELDRANNRRYSDSGEISAEKNGPDAGGAPGALKTKCLQTRLYEHCPFAFTFLAETAVPPPDRPPESSGGSVTSAPGKVLLEQYIYRGLGPSTLPVLEFASDGKASSGGKAYDEIHSSVVTVWQNACPPLSKYDVGTARGLSAADIRNIFAQGTERTKVSQREIESIINACESRNHTDGPTVDVLAVSAKFYLRALLADRMLMETFSAAPGPVMRCALVNPVSQQAIMRAIADEVPSGEIPAELGRWSWDRHRDSSLYNDVHESMRHIDQFNRQHRNGEDRISLRFYSSAIARAMTRTSDAIFVEEYLYGRGMQFKSGTPLGREIPIIEYRLHAEDGQNPPRNPQNILIATFDVIWDSYSIDAATYSLRKEELEFQKNLERLREELGVQLQPTLIAAGD